MREKESRHKRYLFKEIILLLVIAIIAIVPLLKPGYFSMHDDVQVMRLYQMERCFQDGQIPCRWVPDMGAGYGHPLYNFHPVFAYYLGMVFRLFNLSFIVISKLLFLIALVGSGLLMYLLAKDLFGKLAGIVAAVFFIFAPYHAVDIYVRGALTESWGIFFFPLIFWTIYQLIDKEEFKYFVLGILSLAGLFLSHNIMTLLFTPIAFLWMIYWLVVRKKQSLFWQMILMFLWAGGLSAFFLLPAFFERSLVKIETLTSDYYNFRHHFVTIRQLFLERVWGYGPSRPGPEDGMSFQLGWPHWWLAFIGAVLLIALFIKKKKKQGQLLLFPVGLFFLATFLTHAKSIFIWEAIPILSFVQFPWRFLGIVMFAGALIAGGIINFLRKSWQLPATVILVVLTIFLNFNYFQPESQFSKMTEQKKLSGEEWEIQSMATLLDYQPAQVQDWPQSLAPDNPWVVEGEAKITEYKERSNFWRFTIETMGTVPVKVIVPSFDFPEWLVLVDQQPVDYDHDNSLGLISLNVPTGKHTVVGWFEDTPLRTAANLVTLFSFTSLLLLVIWRDRKNDKIT